MLVQAMTVMTNTMEENEVDIACLTRVRDVEELKT